MRMNLKLLALLCLLPLAANAQTKLSTLTAQYSLADAAYGLALNGTTDDGAAANAALSAIGTYKTVVLPPGKTLLTCRPIILRAGTRLIGYGATIKRCNQPSSVTTSTDITSGSTTTITVADTSAFSAGEMVALVGATYYSYGNQIASKTATTITLTAAPQMYNLSTGAAQASVTEDLSVRRVGDLLVMNSTSDDVQVFGLTLDGNKANFASPCRWESCTEIHPKASRILVKDVTFLNSPGEGIQEGAVISGVTNTDITAYTTTTVTLTSSAITAGFKVGDAVLLMTPTVDAFDDNVRRIASIGGVGDVDVTVETPFGLLPPAGVGSGLSTTTDGLVLLKLNEGNVYEHNTFVGLNGNAMHFSGSLGSAFQWNTIKSANADLAVGHQYGAVTYSCYIYNSKILHNDITFSTLDGVGLRGCGTVDVTIAHNNFHAPNSGTADTIFGIDVTASAPQYLKRVLIADNIFNSARQRQDNGGIYVTNASGSTLTADTDPVGPSRIRIERNLFMRSDVFLKGVSRIAIADNTFDNTNLGNVAGGGYNIRLDDVQMVDIIGNQFWRGYNGIYVNAAGDGVNIRGNSFQNQYANSIVFNDADTNSEITIAGNDFYNPNITFSNSSWRGIYGMPIGAKYIGNTFTVGKGVCIDVNPPSARNYGAANAGTVIANNVCKRIAGGSMTYSIRVGANSTGLIVTGNYVPFAITDSGTSTVTTPANIVLP